MLYVLHGTDTIKAREKLRMLLNGLFAKKPDASFFRIDEENFNVSQIEELLFGQGLFAQKYIVVLDGVLQNTEAKEAVLNNLKDIASSQNIFIVFEGALDKATLSKLEKHAEKVQGFVSKTATAATKPFNIFSLTDALGRRDRKRLWILYQKAKHNNVSDEEIHGILFWQVKSMLLARSAESTAGTGLKPFVFQKSLGFSKNYTKQELEKLSASMISLYHDARRGIYELSVAMEQFVLSI